jgi:hypothetical protein
VDWVVTVPVTLVPDWVTLQLTIVVPIPLPAAPVFGFESTPVPLKVGGGPGSGLVELASGMPVPAPQAVKSAANAAAIVIVRTGLMRQPRSPSRLEV